MKPQAEIKKKMVETRQLNTRAKTILGGMMIDKAKGSPEFSMWLKDFIDEYDKSERQINGLSAIYKPLENRVKYFKSVQFNFDKSLNDSDSDNQKKVVKEQKDLSFFDVYAPLKRLIQKKVTDFFKTGHK